MNMKKLWAGIAAFTFFVILGAAWLLEKQELIHNAAPVPAPALPVTPHLSPSVEQAVPASNLGRPAPIFVESVDPNIKHEDFPYSGEDERSSYRQFTVPIKEHDPIVLMAANLDDELWLGDRDNDVALISRLFDLDAAFIPVATYGLLSTGDWERIVVYVGGFAQDGCGGVDLVYSMRKQNIFAVFSANSKDVDFSRSGCPLEQKDFKSSPSGRPNLENEADGFCSYRAKCLQTYYASEANRGTFTSSYLHQIAELSFRIPLAPPVDKIGGSYLVLGDGSEIRDTRTGLIWQRCSVGQIWNGNNCTGNAKKFKFDEAQELTGNGWRVPTVREMASLIYCSTGKTRSWNDPKDGGAPIGSECLDDYQHPAISKNAFPDTPEWGHWTSSPYAGNDSDAWGVAFGNGYVGGNQRNLSSHVRLVRTGQ